MLRFNAHWVLESSTYFGTKSKSGIDEQAKKMSCGQLWTKYLTVSANASRGGVTETLLVLSILCV